MSDESIKVQKTLLAEIPEPAPLVRSPRMFFFSTLRNLPPLDIPVEDYPSIELHEDSPQISRTVLSPMIIEEDETIFASPPVRPTTPSPT